MIFKQIQLIGKAFLGDKNPVEIYIQQQKDYKSPNIIVIDIDLENSDFHSSSIRNEDYDSNKELFYLRGIVGAGSSTRSPFININLTALSKLVFEDTHKQILSLDDNNNGINFEKVKTLLRLEDKTIQDLKKTVKLEQDLIKVMKKPAFSDLSKNNIVRKFYLWVEKEQDNLESFIFNKLFTDYLTWDSKKSSFKKSKGSPGSIVFKIKINEDYLYPGEIQEFVDFYLSLIEDKKVSNSPDYYCYSCNKKSNSINIPTLGIFNLDMTGFVQGFTKKENSTQYSVCDTCYLEFLEGKQIVEQNLSFYAFKSDKGVYDKDGAYINHYIIPVIEDSSFLKKAVNMISKAKEDIGSQEKKSMTNEIKMLDNRIKLVQSGGKKSFEKRKKILEKEILRENTELGSKADILKIYSKLHELESDLNLKIGVLDVYFYVTDVKQNPSTKELLSVNLVTETTIQKIHNAVKAINRKFGENTFSFKSIQWIVGTRNILPIMTSIFNLKKINRNNFLKQSNKIINRSFQYDVIDLENDKIKKFNFLVPIFKKSIYLFNELNIY